MQKKQASAHHLYDPPQSSHLARKSPNATPARFTTAYDRSVNDLPNDAKFERNSRSPGLVTVSDSSTAASPAPQPRPYLSHKLGSDQPARGSSTGMSDNDMKHRNSVRSKFHSIPAANSKAETELRSHTASSSITHTNQSSSMEASQARSFARSNETVSASHESNFQMSATTPVEGKVITTTNIIKRDKKSAASTRSWSGGRDGTASQSVQEAPKPRVAGSMTFSDDSDNSDADDNTGKTIANIPNTQVERAQDAQANASKAQIRNFSRGDVAKSIKDTVVEKDDKTKSGRASFSFASASKKRIEVVDEKLDIAETATEKKTIAHAETTPSRPINWNSGANRLGTGQVKASESISKPEHNPLDSPSLAIRRVNSIDFSDGSPSSADSPPYVSNEAQRSGWSEAEGDTNVSPATLSRKGTALRLSSVFSPTCEYAICLNFLFLVPFSTTV